MQAVHFCDHIQKRGKDFLMVLQIIQISLVVDTPDYGRIERLVDDAALLSGERPYKRKNLMFFAHDQHVLFAVFADIKSLNKALFYIKDVVRGFARTHNELALFIRKSGTAFKKVN